MNKKVLVLTLALVVAFASSAMAAVNFGGEFGAKIEQDILAWPEDGTGEDAATTDSFKFLDGKYEFTQNIKLNLKSSSDTWSLNVNFANRNTDARPDDFLTTLDNANAYTLKVTDDLFGLTVWRGTSNNQGYVNDPFSLVRGRNQNAAATIRAKAPIMDVADVTLQLEPTSSVLGFVTADVAGAEVGLAVQRKFNDTELREATATGTGEFEWKEVKDPVTGDFEWKRVEKTEKKLYSTVENALDTVVLHAAYDFEVAKVTVGGGMSINNTKESANYEDLTAEQKAEVDKLTKKLEDNLSYAVKVEAPVTDQIKAEASYVVKQKDWKGNGSNSTAATLKGTYKADDLTVNGSVTSTGKHINDPETDDNRTTTFALDGTYSITADIKATAGAEYKIEKDKYAAQVENINTTKINASVSAPIVADLATAEVKLGYTGDNLGAIQVGKYRNSDANWGATGATLRNTQAFALAKSLFEAEANIKVTPVEKLTVTPAVVFKSFKDGNRVDAQIKGIKPLRDSDYHGDYSKTEVFTAGSVLTLKADATYKIGGGATITLSAGNHTYDFTKFKHNADPAQTQESTLKYNNPFASVAVKVTF